MTNLELLTNHLRNMDLKFIYVKHISSIMSGGSFNFMKNFVIGIHIPLTIIPSQTPQQKDPKNRPQQTPRLRPQEQIRKDFYS